MAREPSWITIPKFFSTCGALATSLSFLPSVKVENQRTELRSTTSRVFSPTGRCGLVSENQSTPPIPAVAWQRIGTRPSVVEKFSSDEETGVDGPGASVQGQLSAYLSQPTGFLHYLSPFNHSPSHVLTTCLSCALFRSTTSFILRQVHKWSLNTEGL